MHDSLRSIEVVLFDFGNTLVEFTHDQGEALDLLVRNEIETRFGPIDHTKFAELMKKEIEGPFQRVQRDFYEECFATLHPKQVELLTGSVDIEAAQRSFESRQTFLAAVTDIAPPERIALLHHLTDIGLRIAVLSNYPDGPSVRLAVEKCFPDVCFEFVLASGDVQYRKPSRILFNEALTRLEVPPEKVLYVGDLPKVDVVGANSIGMLSCLTKEFRPFSHFVPDNEDAQLCEPTVSVESLEELVTLFQER